MDFVQNSENDKSSYEAVEKMRLREALHDILFTFESDLAGTIREQLQKTEKFQEFCIKSIHLELQCCHHLPHT